LGAEDMNKLLCALVMLGLPLSAAVAADEIDFPDGYRTWTHIRSAVVGPKSPASPRFAGMHSIYANSAAMDGYKSGKFPDGSVIVFDNHEVTVFQGTELPAQRRFVDVMAKTRGAWRFSEFAGDSRSVRNLNVAQGQQQCAACHAQSPTDQVYSQFNP
jgi:hypothetical protein